MEGLSSKPYGENEQEEEEVNVKWKKDVGLDVGCDKRQEPGCGGRRPVRLCRGFV